MTITIELTKGQVTLIDDEDADLADFKWYALAQWVGGFYAVRSIYTPERGRVRLHRVVLERVIGRSLKNGEFTDHVNGDKLDNRRGNLRIATRVENQQNRGKRVDNTSGVKGVSRHRASGKWQAEIQANGKQIYLGLFTTPKAAHEAYCKAAQELHGEFARFE